MWARGARASVATGARSAVAGADVLLINNEDRRTAAAVNPPRVVPVMQLSTAIGFPPVIGRALSGAKAAWNAFPSESLNIQDEAGARTASDHATEWCREHCLQSGLALVGDSCSFSIYLPPAGLQGPLMDHLLEGHARSGAQDVGVFHHGTQLPLASLADGARGCLPDDPRWTGFQQRQRRVQGLDDQKLLALADVYRLQRIDLDADDGAVSKTVLSMHRISYGRDASMRIHTDLDQHQDCDIDWADMQVMVKYGEDVGFVLVSETLRRILILRFPSVGIICTNQKILHAVLHTNLPCYEGASGTDIFRAQSLRQVDLPRFRQVVASLLVPAVSSEWTVTGHLSRARDTPPAKHNVSRLTDRFRYKRTRDGSLSSDGEEGDGYAGSSAQCGAGRARRRAGGLWGTVGEGFAPRRGAARASWLRVWASPCRGGERTSGIRRRRALWRAKSDEGRACTSRSSTQVVSPRAGTRCVPGLRRT